MRETADRLLVRDAHRPRALRLEVAREPAARLGPRHHRDHDPALRAIHPRHVGDQFDPPAAEILAPPAAHYDRERVMDCLSKADFGDRLKTLPDGLDTPLYKELDKNGVEVSGGEAQKIDIARDKTAVYISHRLSSCKFCDDIAVFDHGAIVRYGTHDQLVADENGKYYELWHAQAQYYVKE
ncbi:ABC transporter, ATP-binding protein, HlyB family [Bifidobacterium bifidum]|nr:ABC transporter, ATP-binding protein, HlyB family [Bifidobacterium bifidum]